MTKIPIYVRNKMLYLQEESSPSEYVAVRVQLVRVKKGMFGLKDEELSKNVVIPDKTMDAIDFFKEISRQSEKYGKLVVSQ